MTNAANSPSPKQTWRSHLGEQKWLVYRTSTLPWLQTCPMFYRGESSVIPRNLVNRGQFKVSIRFIHDFPEELNSLPTQDTLEPWPWPAPSVAASLSTSRHSCGTPMIALPWAARGGGGTWCRGKRTTSLPGKNIIPTPNWIIILCSELWHLLTLQWSPLKEAKLYEEPDRRTPEQILIEKL